MNKNVRKIIFIFLFNILFIFALFEVMGLLYYYLNNRALFYSRIPNKIHFKESTNLIEQINSKLHPFWGFIYRPGTTLRSGLPQYRLDRMVGDNITPEWINIAVNEYGFYSPYAYPYKAHTNDFIIAIFGGSVAHWLAVQGSKTLINSLRQNNLILKNRSIVVLNFAQGGYKEPQQLLILSYFMAMGQHFDLVINIDGFNEVALSHLNFKNKIDLSFPSSQHVLPIVNTLRYDSINIESLDALCNLGKAKQSLIDIEYEMNRNKSAGFNLIFTMIHRYKVKSYAKRAVHFDKMLNHDISAKESLIMQINRLEAIINEKNEYDYIAQLWANSSILMSHILEKQSVVYYHILQPNQYYSGRSFTGKEAFAFDPESPYKSAIEKGYPVLLKQTDRLHRNGVRFINATKIFDTTSQVIYSDSCCHYNQLGNDLLAAYIAKAMTSITTDN